ncbi:uncharacterized protein LOC141700176 [Apium graveolens]|uniref:uncharacterized protein LOC141700176 n=1 Tax=Apium graveolens TaxID=4045 RepID=UPI003D79F918
MGKDFVWTAGCEESFQKIKEQLENPLMLAKPEDGETLILYLAVSEYSISTELVREEEGLQSSAYYGQALVDFIRKFDSEVYEKAIVLAEPSSQGNSLDKVRERFPHPWWILHVDGAVKNNGAGAGIVLVTLEGHHLMSVIHFKFYVTNNDAEYEALINGLKIALEVGVLNLIAQSDSELVVNQVNGGFQAWGPRTELFIRCVQRLLQSWKVYQGKKMEMRMPWQKWAHRWTTC